MNDDLTPITLKEAEELMGPTLRESNDTPKCGYFLPLDGDDTQFFKSKDYDIVVVRVPKGSSPTACHGTEFEFDGFGWGDMTRYEPGTPGFIQKAKELGAYDILPRIENFLNSLDPDIREKVRLNMHLGLKSVSVHVEDAFIKKQMLEQGDTNELRIAIHANPFITFYSDGVIVGPPWVLKEEHSEYTVAEDIARFVMTRAARR
jgi:hypothetical protein